jgi:hypothetical protein
MKNEKFCYDTWDLGTKECSDCDEDTWRDRTIQENIQD